MFFGQLQQPPAVNGEVKPLPPPPPPPSSLARMEPPPATTETTDEEETPAEPQQPPQSPQPAAEETPAPPPDDATNSSSNSDVDDDEDDTLVVEDEDETSSSVADFSTATNGTLTSSLISSGTNGTYNSVPPYPAHHPRSSSSSRPHSQVLRFSSVPGSPKRESRDTSFFGTSFSTASEMSLYQSALDIPEMGGGRVTAGDPRGSVYSGSGDHVPLSANDALGLEGIAEEDGGGGETPVTPKRTMMSHDAGLYFRDGIRRIDYVLSYNTKDGHQTEAFSGIRLAFEANLIDDQLELEYECEEEKRVSFVKIHVPWKVLTRYAEIMKLKMPMRELSQSVLEEINVPNLFPDLDQVDAGLSRSVIVDEVNSMFRRAGKCFRLDPDTFPPSDKRYTYEYSREKEYLFDIPKNKDEFFSPASRALVVDFILKRTSFSRERGRDLSTGILKLLAEGVYTAGYCLHEGETTEYSTPRGLLRKEWGSLMKMHKIQPLDNIREYFGVMFGLYFAWLGFYTYMLIPASIVGFICFIYGCATLYTNVSSNDICEIGHNITMCPLCDRWCDYWYLNETCIHSRITYLCDNPATIIFAVFMSFWSALFLELWKRYSADITYRWDLTGFDQGEEHPRPEYLARLAKRKKEVLDIVNKGEEPKLSFWKWKLPAAIMSISVVLLLTAVALAAVIGVIFYRMSLMTALTLQYDRNDQAVFNRHAPIITTTTAACINLVCILIFNQVFPKIARCLTDIEMHRTQTEYDDSLTLKMFLLQFINYYASIFYIAFFKGKLVGRPGNYNRIWDYRQEECGPGGCLMELSIQLAIIMVGKQAMNTIIEMIMPKFWRFYQRFQNKISSSKTYIPQTAWERDYSLIQWETQGLFWEYLEMVLQFGFVTIFVAAFPLAPMFALVNNGFEMRLDARKILQYYRRPTANRVKNIGIWYRILDGIGKMAVITNAFIIAFTSTFIPRMVYKHIASEDGSLHGFLDHSLSYFNTSDYPERVRPPQDLSNQTVELCRYEDYREPPWNNKNYDYTPYHWHVLAARLAFVVVFENVVVLTTTLIRWIIPDVPRRLKDTMRREAYIVNEIIVRNESARSRGETGKTAAEAFIVHRQQRNAAHTISPNNVRRRSQNTAESVV